MHSGFDVNISTTRMSTPIQSFQNFSTAMAGINSTAAAGINSTAATDILFTAAESISSTAEIVTNTTSPVAMVTNSTEANIVLGSNLNWLSESYCLGQVVHCTQSDSSISDEESFGATETIWIITSCILIFQMQTGFGLLEAGSVTAKSETNIMVKNALDLVFGGVTYWAFGFAFSFGDSAGSNPFVGVGHYLLLVEERRVGYIYALFLFQLSFATTSMTIVSGAMAERARLISYNIFSMFMTFIYALPAHWMWASNGFLLQLGVQDVAGCGPVHLVGGVTGLVATLMLGPRQGAFDGDRSTVPSPLKSILGMFMLWWGWLRFNSGSVYIVTSGDQWRYAVIAGVNTIIASIGGGVTSIVCSLSLSKCVKFEKRFPYDVSTIVNGILGSLVSITSICTLCQPWEAFIIGVIGAIITVPTEMILRKLKIDDPIGVIPVHAVCAIWGLIAVGLFIPESNSTIPGEGGLFRTGRFYQLGVQVLACVILIVWTVLFAALFLKILDVTIGIRLKEEHEVLGADMVEHGTGGLFTSSDIAADTAVSLTTLGDNILDTEFKLKTRRLLRDLFRSISRQELYLSVKPTSEGTLTLVIQASLDEKLEAEGSSNKGFEPTSPVLLSRVPSTPTKKNIPSDSEPTTPVLLSRLQAEGTPRTKRRKDGTLPRSATEISLNKDGAVICLTDDKGNKKTKIIAAERPSTPGFVPNTTSL